MHTSIDRFYNSIADVVSIGQRELVGFFIYFLTEENSEEFATARAIQKCFKDCRLGSPTRIPQYLSEGIKRSEYIRAGSGYRLQRHHLEIISQQLGIEKRNLASHPELRKLEARVTGSEKAFLKEVIDCFEAGANRAPIIMCWILALDHLCNYTFREHLAAFNAELKKVTDKRVRVTEIGSRDDFSDIPEGKLIELMRSAGVISNDVRKILDEKLGIRNSCAHPSGIEVKPSKALAFVDDLVENVVLKYG